MKFKGFAPNWLYIGFFLILNNSHVFAQRVISADLVYRNVSGLTYEFTLTTYRDCGTVSALPTSYSIIAFSPSCGILPKQYRLSFVSKKEVSAACPSRPSFCQGGDQPGFEKYTYKGTFTLDKACSDWQFNWLECPRPSSITNLQSPDSTCICTKAFLNNIDGGVSSPIFANELTGFVCANSDNTLNLGVQPNGDSLVFTSITPYRSFDPANGNPFLVRYATGFSASKPLSTNQPFTVNSQNGDIRFTPNTANEKVIIAIKVDQFRNRKLVGSVMKDQQIFTYSCQLPSLVATSVPTNVCAKVPITIKFTSSDPNNNKTNLSWNSGILGATFTTNFVSPTEYTLNQTATFTWTPADWQPGIQSFIVKVKNNACPIYGEKSYTFTFNVARTVNITLRDDTLVPCGKTLPIKVSYSGGALPYKTKIWNTGEITDSINKPAGKYKFTIVDDNNCSISDSVTLSNGVGANFYINSTTCAGSVLSFVDLSTTVGAITSWNWRFGTNGSIGSSTQRNPQFTFPNEGVYDVSLTVRDNNGCSDTKTIKLSVCSRPTYSISKLDTCVSRTSVRYIANSTVCPLQSQTIDWGSQQNPPIVNSLGGSLNSITGVVSTTYNWDPNNRNYTISGNLINTGGCSVSASTTVRVYPKPVFIVPLTDTVIYYNCSNPTITLSGLATVTVQGAVAPLQYTWSSGVTPITTNQIEPNLGKVSDTLLYNVTATDARGCTDSRKFEVRYPLRPDFTILGRCVPQDTFKFSDNINSNYPIDYKVWDFGDGTTVSGFSYPANFKIPHVFPKEISYRVTLSVRDNSGCQNSKSKIIYNSVPKNNMPDGIYCFGKDVSLVAPSSDSISGILDRLVWQVKNRSLTDSTWYNKDSTALVNPQDLANFNPTVSFFYPGMNYVYANTTYNYSCKTKFKSRVYIYKDINDSIAVKTQICYNPDIPLEFKAITKVSENPIQLRVWQFLDPENKLTFNPVSIAYSTDPQGKYVVDFPYNSSKIDETGVTTLRMQLTTRDDKGCTKTTFSYFRNEILSKNSFELRGRCVNDDSTGIFIKNLNPINVGGAILFDLNKWEVKGDTIIRGFPTGIFHKFKKGGDNYVTLTCYNIDSTCSIENRDTLFVYPTPRIDFAAPAVCALDTTVIQNLTLPESTSDSIRAYRWTIIDSNPTYSSIQKNIKYKFPQGGQYKVRLYALNSYNCKDSIVKTVTVHPRPKANFMVITDYNNQQSGSPIDFKDMTSFSDNIVKWKWKFTKKDSTTFYSPTDPSFTFDSIQVYNVLQRVTNSLGCSDDTTIRLDLNSYLILPTAFSPNGDTQNDQLFLLYKGIKQLKEFKIYNRFGEKVFDAGQNLNAVWDGTQNGLPSPVGAYVYYVEGTTLYGKVIGQKGQVTLLR